MGTFESEAKNTNDYQGCVENWRGEGKTVESEVDYVIEYDRGIIFLQDDCEDFDLSFHNMTFILNGDQIHCSMHR